MPSPGIGKWRSEAARERFRAMEDELWLERWPEPPKPLDVESFAGVTRLYHWPGTGTPIVFLHGMGGTGLTWSAHIERLAGRDVYAIDTIGDVGRSEQRALIEDADGLARWLDETLAGAGIERAHLAGTSYGGFLALNLAARRPDRVAALTLMDSGGLAPVRFARFLLWGIPTMAGSVAPERVRRRLARTRPLLEDPRVMRSAFHAQRNHRFLLPWPTPLTDDELRAVSAPTVAIVAQKSAPFAARIQAERARLIPNAKVVVVSGARHDLSWSHLDDCMVQLTGSHAP
jgi:pimeloyl-ACP methyl ester carboxylesterase